MPLLSSTRQEARLAPTVPPPGASEVFVIRCTGECVKSYEEYTAKRTQYALPQWQEKYFNKSGLNFEEALAIERSVEEQIRKQFPKTLEREVVRQIHHSTLRKDDLINKIHASLKQGSPGADKENGQQESPAAAPSSSQAAPVTKKLLTQFLIYVADKHKPGVWICKEPWVQQYGLSTELPEGVQLPPAEPASPAACALQAGSVAGDATPMKTPLRGSNASAQPAPVRTLEEEEAKLKPGSMKAIAFQVMKARGASQPVTVDDIIRITTTDGTCIDWPDKRKRSLANVLSSDPAFVRLARRQYSLRALAGDLPLASPLGQGQGAAWGGAAVQDAVAAAFSGGGEAKKKPPKPPREPAAQAGAEEQQQSGLARAEQLLAQAQKALAARQADADAAAAYVEACQKNLAEAKEAKAAAAKAKGKRDSDASAGAAADGKAAAGPDLDAMFVLPEHLREYKGPEDDRKARSAWRHERSNEEKRLKKERDAYLQQQRLEAAKGSRADLAALQQALDRAKKAADDAAGKLERAKKAEGEAKRSVEREKQREMLKDIKEKSKADKEKQKQAEKEERERRRQEALAAKRYPIDDLELLAEEITAAALAAANGSAAAAPAAAGSSAAGAAADAQPSSAAAASAQAGKALLAPEQLDVPSLAGAKHLAPEQSTELGQLLCVADTLSQFARQLGVKGCSSSELQATLQAVASAGAAAGAGEEGEPCGQRPREAQRWLAHTYQQLLKVLVEDVVEMDGAARLFSRWSEVLACGSAAWPDLARRWVLVQQQEGLASPEAMSVAHFLRDHEADCLSPGQHLALLTQLLDDCLDTCLIRDMLSHRIEEAAERAAAVRTELAEGRKKLRELLDAEKESRKRKRAAALALATAAAERQLREKGELPAAADAAANGAAAAGEDAAADAAAAPAAGAEDQVAKKIRTTTKEILERVAGPGISGVTLAELEAELAVDAEEEPTWELPPELHEYSGPEGDKKAMSEFRRKQQEARKQLEKAQARWQADKAKRDKAKAEAKKREVEAERKLQQERQRAEEALAEQQDRLEQQLEKFLVRRQPLGSDRFNRLYWWGLAGNKEGLLLQQEVGCAETMLALLQEAAAEAAAAKQQEGAAAAAAAGGDSQQQEQQQEQEGQPLQRQDSKQPARRASVAEAGVDKQLLAPLNHKGLLLPPGPEGWAVIDDVSLLEGLAGCLEQRGVREKELKASLDKMLPTMSAAIAKAAAAKAAAAAEAAPSEAGSSGRRDKKKEQAAVVHRELPSRHARAAAAEQIRKTGSAAAATKGKEEAAAAAVEQEEEEPTGSLQGWTFAAFKSAVSNLQQLSEAAAAAKAAVPGPSSSWAKYRSNLDALLHGELPTAWAEDAAAAAAALATGSSAAAEEAAAAAAAAGVKDAAWTKAVMAAAQSAAAAVDAPAEQQQQAAASAALAQVRLQLLAFEQQLVAVSGECPYLYGDAVLAGAGDEAAADSDEEGEAGEPSSEGEAEDPQQQLEKQQQQQKTKGRGHPAKQQGQQEAGAAPEEEAMEVDAEEGQQQGRSSRPTKAAVTATAADITGGRGTKRSAAAAAAAGLSGSGQAEEAGEGDAEVAAPAAKRRKRAADAAADGGLPPRPAVRAARGRVAAVAEAAAAEGEGEGEAGGAHGHSPGSREGSVAPSCSGAAAKVGGMKRGLAAASPSAAGSSRAGSQELQQEEAVGDGEEEQQQPQNKKQARRGKAAAGKGGCGKKGTAAASSGDAGEQQQQQQQQEEAAAAGPRGKAVVGFAAAEGGVGGGDDADGMDVDEEEVDDEGGRRRHSLPSKHTSHGHELDDGSGHEDVAEEAETSSIPLRMNGRTVWRTREERDSWRSSVAAAGTAACLAYCTAALVFHADQPMQKLAASAAKKGKKQAGGRQ